MVARGFVRTWLACVHCCPGRAALHWAISSRRSKESEVTMANQPGTLEQIAIRLARTLARLPDNLAGASFPTTLARLGIDFPPALLASPGVVAVRDTLSTAASALPAKVDAVLAAVQAEDLAGILTQGRALLD